MAVGDFRIHPGGAPKPPGFEIFWMFELGPVDGLIGFWPSWKGGPAGWGLDRMSMDDHPVVIGRPDP